MANEQDLYFGGTENITFFEPHGDYIRLTVSDEFGSYRTEFLSNISVDNAYLFYFDDVCGTTSCTNFQPISDTSYSPFITDGVEPQITIYRDSGTDDVYIKPNEILNNAYTPAGKYNLTTDFFRDLWYDSSYQYLNTADGVNFNQTNLNPYFIISEISPSRKEIRLIARYSDNETLFFDSQFQTFVKNNMGGMTDLENPYQFDWNIVLSEGRKVPITNYIFDSISNSTVNVYTGEGVSLIIKFDNPIPADISLFSITSIEKIIFDSQTIEIDFISNVQAVVIGQELTPDFDVATDQNIQSTDQDNYQSYEQLTTSASIADSTLDIINYAIENEDVNLNIDFNYFKNHTFFGSAAAKLGNFKRKVTTIEGHLEEISSSLSVTGSATNKRRYDLFNNIRNQIENFTPYERFLYYDSQNQSSASAPGVGVNLAPTKPIAHYATDPTRLTTLPNYDGLGVVYKLQNTSNGEDIHIAKDTYFADKAPFYNHDGSVYLSFLIKASSSLDDSFTLTNTNNAINIPIPTDTWGGSFTQTASLSEKAYRRFIIEASQSYWRPSGSAANAGALDNNAEGDISLINPHWGDSSYWEILSTPKQVFSASMSESKTSYGIYDASGYYGELLTPSIYEPGGSGILRTDLARTGSVLPSGELFDLKWNHGAAAVSFIADFKVTLKDPRDTLPFSHLYSVSSSKFINWYDGLYSSASNFDGDNVHSLLNNTPDFYTVGDDTTDFKNFVDMIGEHFDLIRNYVDTYHTFTNRGYTKDTSAPTNLLSVLGQSFGWNFINPYSSSLYDYFDNSFQGDTMGNIKDSTWTKVLNNLIYIYKSKGTTNSVRALLNSYGYPPDLVKLQEYGSSLVSQEDELGLSYESGKVGHEPTALMGGLRNSVKNISYTKERKNIKLLSLRGADNQLNLDWWTNDAKPLDTIKFIFRSPSSTVTQSLLESSGSAGETMWRVNIIPSASDPKQAQTKFYLNNTMTGSSDVVTNSVTMTSTYLPINNGELWNFMLKRNNSKISGSGTNTYKMFIGMQENDKIKYISVASMSVSGAMTGSVASNRDSNYYANTNWYNTGSLNTNVSGNLIVGRAFSGSIYNIQAWTEAISASVFRKSIINKNFYAGNSLDSSQNNLVYHFKLQDGNSINKSKLKIVDSTPNTIKDFSRKLSFETSSFDRRQVDLYRLTIKDGDLSQNDNKVLVDLNLKDIPGASLNPYRSSVKTQYSSDDNTENRNTSQDVEIVRSIATKINSYIFDSIGGNRESILDKFADPSYQYSSSYGELDSFRDILYKGINIDVDRWMDAQKTFFNPSLIENIQSLLPARSQLNKVGVMIEPTVLERTKIKNNKIAISTNTGAHDTRLYITSQSINLGSSTVQSDLIDKDGFLYIASQSLVFKASQELTKDSTLYITSQSVNIGALYNNYFTDMYMSSSFNLGASKLNLYSDNINMINQLSFSGSRQYFLPSPYVIQMFMTSSLGIKSSKLNLYSDTINIANKLSFSGPTHNFVPYGTNINVPTSSIDLSATYESLYSDTINMINKLSFSGSRQYFPPSPYVTKIFMTSSLGIKSSKLNLYSDTINMANKLSFSNLENKKLIPYLSTMYMSSSFNLGSQKIKLHSDTINMINQLSFSGSQQHFPLVPYLGTMFMTSSIKSNFELLTLKNIAINISSESINLSSNYIKSYDADNRQPADFALSGRLSWQDEYGNPITNLCTHKDSNGNYVYNGIDSGTIDRRQVYYTIGDWEDVSGSALNGPGSFYYIDYNNVKTFKGRQFTDEGKGFKYRPLTPGTDGIIDYFKTIDARPIGKTGYFVTASYKIDGVTNKGDIVYPSNHYIHFSNEFKNNIAYLGAQNSYPMEFAFPNDITEDDLWKYPFYTVSVGGTDTETSIFTGPPNTMGSRGV